MNKEIRLRKNREFQTVYRRGKNFWNKDFTIFIRPTNRNKVKFGVSITKKFGKANKRNLIKRRIRQSKEADCRGKVREQAEYVMQFAH